MKGDKKPVGLLIGIGRPKASEGDSYDEPMDDADDSHELKVTAARALLSAIKSNDPEALTDALDAFMEC
jgi:hypothetical protein